MLFLFSLLLMHTLYLTIQNNLKTCNILIISTCVSSAIRIKGNEEVICGNSAIFDAEVEQAENFCLPIIWQRRRGKWVEIIDPTLEKYSGSTNTRLVMSSVCKMDAMEYQAFLPDGYNQMLYSNTINLQVLGGMLLVLVRNIFF